MKKEFSKHWKKSKQPRKKRKYAAKAPLHIKRKFLSANLNKELRKKYGKRSVVLRKGDVVKIMRGKFKKKQGKVLEIKTKYEKIYVEGMTKKKQDGSNAKVPLKSSNLQIVELNLEDKKRLKSQVKDDKSKEKKQETKSKETKQIKETK